MRSSKNIFLSFLLSMIFHQSVLSQQCAVYKVPYISISLNDSFRLKMVYDSISNDMSGNTTLLLINNYAQVQRRKAYVITVDSLGSVIGGYKMTEDITGVTSKKAIIKSHYKSPPSDTLRTILLLGSSSIGEAHMNSILLVSNKREGIWLEYEDEDGNGHSCIGKSDAPVLMKYAVEILEDIFKDALKYSMY